jgi:hypothetical protein
MGGAPPSLVDRPSGSDTITTRLKIFCSFKSPTTWQLGCQAKSWLSCDKGTESLPICPGQVPLEGQYYDSMPHSEVLVTVHKDRLAPGLNMTSLELRDLMTGQAEPIQVFASTSH